MLKPGTPEEVVDIMQKSWDADPEMRPTARGLLNIVCYVLVNSKILAKAFPLKSIPMKFYDHLQIGMGSRAVPHNANRDIH